MSHAPHNQIGNTCYQEKSDMQQRNVMNVRQVFSSFFFLWIASKGGEKDNKCTLSEKKKEKKCGEKRNYHGWMVKTTDARSGGPWFKTPVVAVVLMGKAPLYPHCLVPWRGRKTGDALVDRFASSQAEQRDIVREEFCVHRLQCLQDGGNFLPFSLLSVGH